MKKFYNHEARLRSANRADPDQAAIILNCSCTFQGKRPGISCESAARQVSLIFSEKGTHLLQFCFALKELKQFV